jgi:hypothetical protein
MRLPDLSRFYINGAWVAPAQTPKQDQLTLRCPL